VSERLPSLSSTALVRAYDDGDHVELYAAANYGEDPERLDVDEVRELRDWLNVWLAHYLTGST
jgi:hypothetical protein